LAVSGTGEALPGRECVEKPRNCGTNGDQVEGSRRLAMGPEKAQSGRRDGISNSLIAVISFDGPKYVDIHVHVQTTDYNMRI